MHLRDYFLKYSANKDNTLRYNVLYVEGLFSVKFCKKKLHPIQWNGGW
jgi:hypothetical protein